MWILLVMTLNGTPAQFATFKDSTEAAAYKTLLFDYNRKNGRALKEHGWAEYDRCVTIKSK